MSDAGYYLKTAMKTYQSMSDRDGQDVEFVPMLHFITKEDNYIVLLDAEGTLPEILAKSLVTLLLKFKKPATQIVVVSDAFSQKMPKGTDPETHEMRPGELHEKFADGDSTIIETLVCIVENDNGKSEAASVGHRWTPVDGLEWDEIHEVEGKPGGMVSKVLRRFFELQHQLGRMIEEA